MQVVITTESRSSHWKRDSKSAGHWTVVRHRPRTDAQIVWPSAVATRWPNRPLTLSDQRCNRREFSHSGGRVAKRRRRHWTRQPPRMQARRLRWRSCSCLLCGRAHSEHDPGELWTRPHASACPPATRLAPAPRIARHDGAPLGGVGRAPLPEEAEGEDACDTYAVAERVRLNKRLRRRFDLRLLVGLLLLLGRGLCLVSVACGARRGDLPVDEVGESHGGVLRFPSVGALAWPRRGLGL